VHCSANERRADEASRDVEAWLKCYFIKDKLGEEFTGVVSGVTTFGIFVQLDALYVEGLVHITELGTDFFQYDDARHELRGERTGKRYQLTDRVTVQVSRVDLEARKIDLVLAGGDSASADRAWASRRARPTRRSTPSQPRRASRPPWRRRAMSSTRPAASSPNGAKSGTASKAKPVSKTSRKKR
jgi:ribonuclease R